MGVFCGKILGDLGADVVVIEPPEGNRARNIGPFYHDIPHPEKSLYWFAYNTSKRGITLNIETSDGQEIFRNLAKTASFVIESCPPGYMNKLGLGYADLSQCNPRIIVTSITPFGQQGPYANYKSSDIISMAMSGLMYICGDADRAPLRFTAEQAYCHAGLQAAVGTIIAFYHQVSSGKGQYVDVSIQESVLRATMVEQHFWDLKKIIQRRAGDKTFRGNISTRVIFPCKDGFVAWRLFVGQVVKKTQALVAWMDEEGMAGDLKEADWGMDMNAATQKQIDHWEEQFAQFFL
jgi:crotonobetainyl-CoA:carnitine CoA-transferase CaiB-like acyl-CoA transferase